MDSGKMAILVLFTKLWVLTFVLVSGRPLQIERSPGLIIDGQLELNNNKTINIAVDHLKKKDSSEGESLNSKLNLNIDSEPIVEENNPNRRIKPLNDDSLNPTEQILSNIPSEGDFENVEHLSDLSIDKPIIEDTNPVDELQQAHVDLPTLNSRNDKTDFGETHSSISISHSEEPNDLSDKTKGTNERLDANDDVINSEFHDIKPDKETNKVSDSSQTLNEFDSNKGIGDETNVDSIETIPQVKLSGDIKDEPKSNVPESEENSEEHVDRMSDHQAIKEKDDRTMNIDNDAKSNSELNQNTVDSIKEEQIETKPKGKTYENYNNQMEDEQNEMKPQDKANENKNGALEEQMGVEPYDKTNDNKDDPMKSEQNKLEPSVDINENIDESTKFEQNEIELINGNKNFKDDQTKNEPNENEIQNSAKYMKDNETNNDPIDMEPESTSEEIKEVETQYEPNEMEPQSKANDIMDDERDNEPINMRPPSKITGIMKDDGHNNELNDRKPQNKTEGIKSNNDPNEMKPQGSSNAIENDQKNNDPTKMEPQSETKDIKNGQIKSESNEVKSENEIPGNEEDETESEINELNKDQIKILPNQMTLESDKDKMLNNQVESEPDEMTTKSDKGDINGEKEAGVSKEMKPESEMNEAKTKETTVESNNIEPVIATNQTKGDDAENNHDDIKQQNDVKAATGDVNYSPEVSSADKTMDNSNEGINDNIYASTVTYRSVGNGFTSTLSAISVDETEKKDLSLSFNSLKSNIVHSSLTSLYVTSKITQPVKVAHKLQETKWRHDSLSLKEDTNIAEHVNTESDRPCTCLGNSDELYTSTALVASTCGGVFIGVFVVLLASRAMEKCKRYLNGDYRPVPMEYDFELNPRLKTH